MVFHAHSGIPSCAKRLRLQFVELLYNCILVRDKEALTLVERREEDFRRKMMSANTKFWICGLGLLALTCAASFPLRHAGFIWDDSFVIVDNEQLRTGQGLYDLWFTTKHLDPCPIVLTLFWAEWHIWGYNPPGFHVVNVFTHALGAVLFWRVLLRLGGARLPRFPRGAAWLAAAVFAVHPVCMSSVGWVSEQKNTCSIVFYLLTLLWFLRFKGDGGRISYGLALFFFACALLSKGSVVTLPAVLLLMAWWREGRITWRDFLQAAPFFALSLGGALMTIWYQNHRAISGGLGQDLDWPGRVAAAAWAVWFYLWKGLAPVHLCAIYPMWRINWHSIQAWLPAVALAALFGVCWLYRNTWGRHLLFGLGCFVVTLFPVMGFFNMSFLAYSRVADHWHYLALLDTVALAVGVGVCGFQKAAARFGFSKLAGPAVAGVLLALLTAGAWTRAKVYACNESLWADTIKKNPQIWIAYNNLASSFFDAGQYDEPRQLFRHELATPPHYAATQGNLRAILAREGTLAQAERDYTAALGSGPDNYSVHKNLADVLFARGKWEKAQTQYEAALRASPGSLEARNGLAGIQDRKDELDQAVLCYENAIQLLPKEKLKYYSYYYDNLAKVYRVQNNMAKAEAALEKAIQLNGDDVQARLALGDIRAFENRWPEVVEEYKAVIRLEPDDIEAQAKLAKALFNAGAIDEALSIYRQVTKAIPEDAQAHSELGSACLIRGKYDDALIELKEAVRLAPHMVSSLNNLAWLLATCPQENIRNGGEAVRLAEQAAEMTGRHDPGILDTLAAAYAAAGRFDDAVETAEQAQKMAADASHKKAASDIAQRLALYRTRKPFIDSEIKP